MKKMLKKCLKPQHILKILLIGLPAAFLLNIYFSVPGQLRIPENTAYNLPLEPFCSVTENRADRQVSASSAAALAEEEDGTVMLKTTNTGQYSLTMKLFSCIPVKTIDVSVTPQTYVVPSGSPIGIRLHTEGLLIVSISDVITAQDAKVSPAKDAGLRTGDRILAVNGVSVDSSEAFSKQVNKICTTLTLTVARDEETLEIPITPVLSAEEEKYKLGMWVRDSTAGIGTLTFYDPRTAAFGALGHGITDVDTGDIMTVSSGSITGCQILSAVRGESGTPGELTGSFSGNRLGHIAINSELGIYGHMENFENLHTMEPVAVATRFQVKEGPAVILADVDGNGVQEYQVNIEKISKSSGVDNKGIVLKITDSALLEKTGGIVQGMSGSPIIQNSRIVGAVTHV